MLRHIIKTTLTGFIATLPLVLTIVVLYWMVKYIILFLGPDSFIGEILSAVGLRFVASEFVAYLFGLLIALGLIYLLGLLVQYIFKGRLSGWLERLFKQLPLVGKIYTSVSKLIQIFDQNEKSDIKAMSPVMCYFGGRDGTAVLALMPSSKIVRLNDRDYYGVLIPTAPVPFGGALIYVPVESVEPIDMAIDELVNVYMSMGATSHDFIKKSVRNG
jgi:uncharacterized membrane protein